ncbi:MAG: DUF2291 domain-containing protein [Prevotellaceae bacterium]|jgi:predicted lipoprotein|nr:DUF2291 domain-containing protein [Prevotellaceae bacterium]
MKKKTLLCWAAGLAIAAFLLYHSVYITPLSAHRAALEAAVFNPATAVADFWQQAPAVLQKQAIPLADFCNYAPEEVAERFGHTLGIGAPTSICLVGQAVITEVGEDLLRLQSGEGTPAYYLRIGSIFSNTVREASGVFNIDDFETTMDFNLVSIELNKRIREQVIAPVIGRLTVGTTVAFTGAADIRPDRPPVEQLVIIPVQLHIVGAHE